MKIDRVGVADLLSAQLLEALATWWWALAAALVLAILSLFAPRRERPPKSRVSQDVSKRSHSERMETSRSEASRLGDPKAQMEFIAKVDFEPRRLLNKSEYKILQILEKIAQEMGERHRVMAQTCLGEIMATRATSASKIDRDLAFRSINSKRLDFLVIDRIGMPVLAVEYQGHGHYQGKAFIRDAVKREAIRKARIKFLEIPAEYNAVLVETQVRTALQAGQAHGP